MRRWPRVGRSSLPPRPAIRSRSRSRSRQRLTWAVRGGDTLTASGLFAAESTACGPFTVTASGGGASGTASVTVSSASVVLGERAILGFSDRGNGKALSAHQATLARAGTLQYVTTASGKLCLRLYDATSPREGRGARVAETAEITRVTCLPPDLPKGERFVRPGARRPGSVPGATVWSPRPLRRWSGAAAERRCDPLERRPAARRERSTPEL